MEPKPWEGKETPWCMIGLVFGILTCLVFLLIGNLDTAGALSGMGESSNSWSEVALELGKSLNHELDWLMEQVDEKFRKSLNQSAHIQELIDLFLALTGNMTDTLATSNITKAACLLQSQSFQHAINNGHTHFGPIGGMSGVVLGTVDQVIDQFMMQLLASLDQLIATLKPALEQVGMLMIKFGDNVQATLQSFSATLDAAQKMLDEMMSGMSQGVGNSDELLNATLSLFDSTGIGVIGAEEITLVAQTYKISALDGDKSLQLVKKYDRDRSGKLNKKEFAEMVEDSSIPDILAVTLRSFAMRLSEVSGLLAHAKSKDDVVHSLVSYLQLAGATDMTQVAWISHRLINASMPKQFAGDVMVSLALQEDNRNALQTLDIGQAVVSTMMSLNPAYTLGCYEQLSNPDYWHSEGYDPTDYSVVVERLTRWIVQGSSATSTLVLETSFEGGSVAADKPPVAWVDRALLNAMPLIAKKHAAKRMDAHVMMLQAKKHAHYNELYASKTSQTMLLHLLGGVHAADISSSSNKAARAISRGQVATPAMLEFATVLSWNASKTAERFQGYCFDMTRKSSNSIDGFAIKMQGIAKKMQLFTEQMHKHANPAAIEDLGEKVEFFAAHGLQDMSKAVRKGLGELLHATSPRIDDPDYSAAYESSNTLGYIIGKTLGKPVGHTMKPNVNNIMGNWARNSSLAAHELGDLLENKVGIHLTEVSGDSFGEILGEALEESVKRTFERASDALSKLASPSSLLRIPAPDVLGPPEMEEQFGKAGQQAKKAMQLATTAGERDAIGHQTLRSEMLALQQNLHESRLIGVMRAALSCRNGSRCPNNVSFIPPWKDMSSWKDLAKLIPTSTDQAASEAASVASSGSAAKDSLTSHWQQGLGELDGEEPDLTDAWITLTQLLRLVQNYVPLAKEKLKWVRQELSKVEGVMDSAFVVFEQKAPPTFDGIAHTWRLVWLLYFCVMTPLIFLMLFYSFWAGGYFGGPGDPPQKEEPEMTPEVTPEMTPETEEGLLSIFTRLQACCDTVSECSRNAHDSNTCFWFVFVIFQIFVMTLFLVSMAFATLAGVKAFVGTGCGLFYALRDGQICGETLLKLQAILSVFMKSTPLDAVPGVCDEKQMLICHMVGEKMKWSAIFTSVGSFFAAVLGFQMLVECEILHTRAAERHRLALADKNGAFSQ